jgi:hypothetical protein
MANGDELEQLQRLVHQYLKSNLKLVLEWSSKHTLQVQILLKEDRITSATINIPAHAPVKEKP